MLPDSRVESRYKSVRAASPAKDDGSGPETLDNPALSQVSRVRAPKELGREPEKPVELRSRTTSLVRAPIAVGMVGPSNVQPCKSR